MYHAASGTYHIWWLDRSASPTAWGTPAAGSSGPATWTISAPRAIAVWMTALRAAP
jgi:hypothetical protein